MATRYWHRTSLTGGTDGSLDNINGALLSDGDKAYVATTSAFYVYSLNASSGAAESSPERISPDTNAGNKRWELVQSFSSKTMATISKTIGATGDYATHAAAMEAVPDLLAHSVTHTIQAGTTLTEVCYIRNKHGVTTSGSYTLQAEKYYPTTGIIPTADSATATTLVDADLATAALGDDYFNGCWIFIVDGTGTDNGFVAITDYTDSTGTVTVASWPGTQPDATSRYMIVGALIDSYTVQVTRCTAYIKINGIGVKDCSGSGITIGASTQVDCLYSGAYNTEYDGVYVYDSASVTIQYDGVVACNSLSSGIKAGIRGDATNWFAVRNCLISDNNNYGILVRFGTMGYISDNAGDNNGTYGTYAQHGGIADVVGTECSGSSGDHSNGSGDGSLAY